MTTMRENTEAALANRRLLEHPFYRRWTAGEVSRSELARYAAQYRHFERALPAALAMIASRLPEGDARALVEANLSDELNPAQTHLELFSGFAAALDAEGEEPATPATARLVQLYLDSASHGEIGHALGVVAAYEAQAAEVAKTKAEGLREHYGLDDRATAFWDVHAELEDEHATWTVSALEDEDEGAVCEGLRASADAWWAFLDEREAEHTSC